MKAVPEDVLALEDLDLIGGADAPTSLADLAVQFDVERLNAPPALRKVVLTVARTGKPFLVAGKPGLLAAKGGTGKTMFVLQLAVAQAAGLEVFGLSTGKPAHVLLALGEEDAEEVHRRLHHICRAMELTDAQRVLVAMNITILPLAGVGVALTHDENSIAGGLPETSRAEEIRHILRTASSEGRPFALVFVDPLSRFAGAETEKDNSAATRFVQVVETFTAPDCGSPAVIVVHHLRKQGRDETGDVGELIRGSVGLVDGVRWAAVIVSMKPKEGQAALLKLVVVKTNYTATPDELILCRPVDSEGTLRLATPGEIVSYEVAKAARGSGGEDLTAAVLESLTTKPASASELSRRLRKGKAAVLQATEDLATSGTIHKVGREWSITTVAVSDRSNGSQTSTSPVRSGLPPLGETETETDPD